MSKEDEKDELYRVDTVPPPAGENDAYNAPTKVGPMPLSVLDAMKKATMTGTPLKPVALPNQSSKSASEKPAEEAKADAGGEKKAADPAPAPSPVAQAPNESAPPAAVAAPVTAPPPALAAAPAPAAFPSSAPAASFPSGAPAAASFPSGAPAASLASSAPQAPEPSGSPQLSAWPAAVIPRNDVPSRVAIAAVAVLVLLALGTLVFFLR